MSTAYDPGGGAPAPGPRRCEAAHPDDHTPCTGPVDAVRVVDQTGAEVSSCVEHAAATLAAVDGTRVYPGPVQGAAIEAYELARARARYAAFFGSPDRADRPPPAA